MEQGVFLVIIKGEPYKANEVVHVGENELILGRQWINNQPDIAFSSPYISRRHAVIRSENNEFTITDLMSKSGTKINGIPIHSTPYVLRDGDRISLAREEAVLVFTNTYEKDLGHTLDLTNLMAIEQEKALGGLSINLDRREVLIDGVPLYLSGKDADLLLLLFERVNQAVSYDEIRINIWPERLFNTDSEIPDVGRDEINALVYRLRKRLGKYGARIITIPRYGYMLDL